MIFSIFSFFLNIYIMILPNILLETIHFSDNGKQIKSLIENGRVVEGNYFKPQINSDNVIIFMERPTPDYIIDEPYLRIVFFENNLLGEYKNETTSNQFLSIVEERILVNYYLNKIYYVCSKNNNKYMYCSNIE